MRMRNRRFVAFVVVMLALIGAVLLYVRDSQVSTRQISVTESGASHSPISSKVATAADSRVNPSINASTSNAVAIRLEPSPALPAPGTQVADVLRALQQAADQGEPHAACRLGVDLARCANAFRTAAARESRASPEVIASTFAPEQRDAFLAGQRQVEAALKDSLAACQGISPEIAKRSGQYLFMAAQNGSVAAMSKYARDPPVDSSKSAEYADEIIQYRDNAARFLSQAVKGGDVMALYVSWYGADTGQSMLGKGVFQKDPYNAVAYGVAAQSLVAGARQRQIMTSLGLLSQGMDSKQYAQAVAEGEKLRDQYFAEPIPPASQEDDGGVDASFCAR